MTTVTVGWSSNPLVERLRALGVRGDGDVPTLFSTGDLPPWTASGIDPTELLAVPAAARHAAASTASVSHATTILERYQAPASEWLAAEAFADQEGNREYEARVARWCGLDRDEVAVHWTFDAGDAA